MEKDPKDMAELKSMPLAKQIAFLESLSPGCHCGSWDCYDCYLTAQMEDEIASIKKATGNEPTGT